MRSAKPRARLKIMPVASCRAFLGDSKYVESRNSSPVYSLISVLEPIQKMTSTHPETYVLSEILLDGRVFVLDVCEGRLVNFSSRHAMFECSQDMGL
jgi:hypothetical protein